MTQTTEEPVDGAPDADGLLGALIDTGAQLQARFEKELSTLDLSLAKLGLLTTLADEGTSLPLSELAERQRCVRSNITQLVDRLEAAGLVRRVPDPADRRSVRAALTERGALRQAAGARRVREVKKRFLARIPGRDRADLRRLLSLFD
jgi:DNA-binding MarR family transcriptional regulator